MSLAIDIDKVSDVLLADGWHHVKFADAKSTFAIDAYEYIQNRSEGRDPIVELGGGQCEGVPSTGATWFDADLNKQISCPLTSVLAVAHLAETDEAQSVSDVVVGGAELKKPDW